MSQGTSPQGVRPLNGPTSTTGLQLAEVDRQLLADGPGLGLLRLRLVLIAGAAIGRFGEASFECVAIGASVPDVTFRSPMEPSIRVPNANLIGVWVQEAFWKDQLKPVCHANKSGQFSRVETVPGF